MFNKRSSEEPSQGSTKSRENSSLCPEKVNYALRRGCVTSGILEYTVLATHLQLRILVIFVRCQFPNASCSSQIRESEEIAPRLEI